MQRSWNCVELLVMVREYWVDMVNTPRHAEGAGEETSGLPGGINAFAGHFPGWALQVDTCRMKGSRTVDVTRWSGTDLYGVQSLGGCRIIVSQRSRSTAC